MTQTKKDYYEYNTAEADHTQGYLWQNVFDEINKVIWQGEKKVFDLGCGNGALAGALSMRGYSVVGVDPSPEGIEIGRKAHPKCDLHVGNAYEDLATKFGQFECLVSLEVVEHVYDPRKYAQCVYELLKPGGVAIISTPYHGFLKNLALSLTNKWDAHLSPLWDHGHIKFWSIASLTALLNESKLTVERFHRVGRIPVLAKSMIAIARKSS